MTDIRAETIATFDAMLRSSQRRDFLKLAAMGGMGVFLSAAATGCHDVLSINPSAHATFAMGSTSGPLNVIYAYSWFMAEFYARVWTPKSQFAGMTATEKRMIDVLVMHKKYHATALQKLIPSGRITDVLLFDFTTLDFGSRASVMGFAQTFEDLGVAATQSLAASFTNAKDLLLVSKIASVWARHATIIRDLNYITGNAASRADFADDSLVDPASGFTPTKDLPSVISAIQPYFTTTLTVG